MRYTQLKWQPERSRTYLGSPSLAILPDGTFVASHDYFGPGCPRNHEEEESLTSIYRSEDGGATWTLVTHVMNSFWASLFVHAGELYLLGVSQQYGSIVIRRSSDGGFTWSHPADESSGLLFPAGTRRTPPNYHCAPVPVLQAGGRLYRAFEDCTPDQWPQGFRSLVISAPEEADLLQASSWRMSNSLAFDPAWVPQSWGELEAPGWLEGNLVADPGGKLWNILRFNSAPVADKAAMVEVRQDGGEVRFDPQSGFIDFPGGMSKFTIRRDAETGLYLSLVNNNTMPGVARQRNVLSLVSSQDLRHWSVVKTLMEDDTGLEEQDSLRLTGFQYVDWQFHGEELVYLVRASYRGGHNYHDANRILFAREPAFRRLL